VHRFGGFVTKYIGDGMFGISAIRKRERTTPSGLCARVLESMMTRLNDRSSRSF
jgi:hypothetical protein